MSTPFDGTWIGEREIPLEVTSQGDFLQVQYTNGGAPFTAFVATLGVPVIYTQWGYAQPYVGVLTDDGNQVLWQNKTVWNRVQS
jgi:hypothetical protein